MNPLPKSSISRQIKTFGLTLTVCFLTACGQKGALYLPEKNNDDKNATLSSQSQSQVAQPKSVKAEKSVKA